MDNTKRQNQILDLLRESEKMEVARLASLLNVTKTTIRRDLTFLEETRQITRSRGYASINHELYFSDFTLRKDLQEKEKNLIAKKAISCISPEDSIIIDSGSTCLTLAKQIRHSNFSDLSIITSCLPVAMELSFKYQVTVSGGIVHSPSMTLIGPEADLYYTRIQASKVFISSTGIRGFHGVTAASPFHVSLKRHMIDAADQVILLLDSSKFNSKGIHLTCDFSKISTIITCKTESNLPCLEKLRETGVELLFIDSENSHK